jgi:type VI secretion system protein ImpM
VAPILRLHSEYDIRDSQVAEVGPLGLFGRKKKPLAVGIYGKHPTAADFIRVNASSEILSAFDRWLSDSLVTAQRRVASWPAVYKRAEPASFVFAGAGSLPCLIGCLAPSRDQSSRYYPLVVFAEVEPQWAQEAYPSLAFDSFVRSARELLERRDSHSHDALAQQVRELARPNEHSIEQARLERDRYLDQVEASSALEPMLGRSKARQHAAVAQMRQIGEATHGATSIGGFGIRCPTTGNSDGNVGFWLTLLQRNLAIPLVPNAIWTSETLLVYLKRPTALALAALWQPPIQDDNILDLAAPDPDNETGLGGETPSEGVLRTLLD